MKQLLGIVLLTLACGDSTGLTSIDHPNLHQILARRAEWDARHITSYSYTYSFWAFNYYAGHPIQVTVLNDTVRSAVVLDTGDSLDASWLPTINRVFDVAVNAAIADAVSHIDFDADLSYPTHIRIKANPDALSSVDASALVPAP